MFVLIFAPIYNSNFFSILFLVCCKKKNTKFIAFRTIQVIMLFGFFFCGRRLDSSLKCSRRISYEKKFN